MKQLIISLFSIVLMQGTSAQELQFSSIPPVNEVSVGGFDINSRYMILGTTTEPRRVLQYDRQEGGPWVKLPESITGFFDINLVGDDDLIINSETIYNNGSIEEILINGESIFAESRINIGDTIVYYGQDSTYYFSEDLGQSFIAVLKDTINYEGANIVYHNSRFYHIKIAGNPKVFIYSDQFDLIASIDIPRGSYRQELKQLHLVDDKLYVFSNSTVSIIDIMDFSIETYNAEGLFNGIILDKVIYYDNRSEFYALPIDDLINQIPPIELFKPSSTRNIIEYDGLVYLIHSEGVMTYEPLSQELSPLDLNLTFTSYIDMDVYDNELIAVTASNNLYESTVGEEWNRLIIDEDEKFITAKKTLTGDNLVIADRDPFSIRTLGTVYLNQDSIQYGGGNIFNLGIDSLLFAQPRCTDISGPPRQISSDQGSTWQDIDFTRCFPFYARTSIVDGRLYFYDNTFTDRPSSSSSTWRDYWATWLGTDDFSSGHIEPHIDIPYRNASVLITEEGILHINPLDSMDQGQSSYVSFDFGQTYTELAAAPNGDLYAAPDGATIVVNNDMGVPRIYHRQTLDDPYIEFTITPSGLYPIDRFIFLEDGRGLITTNSGQILLTNGFTSSTNNHSTLKEVKIYPNPSQGQVNFDQIDNYTDYQFSVYTSTGERLFACDGCNRLEGTLENGIYFIVGINQNERVMSKLVVSKK